jgi:hypothetical protein
MRLLLLLPVITVAGCTTPQVASQAEIDLAAVRQVSMSGPAMSWSELRVHPALIQRACAVDTLVSETGEVIGYCRAGRQCRTNDWRPVSDGCGQGLEYRSTPPADPSTLTAPAVDIAGVR